MVPFFLLYLTALPNRFIIILCSWSASPFSIVCCIFSLCLRCIIPVSSSCPCISTATSFIRSSRSNGSSCTVRCPDSSLLISSTSFTRSIRCLVEISILSTESSSFSWLFQLFRITCIIPRIPLIGVRRSWLIRFMNSVFVLLSISAFS